MPSQKLTAAVFFVFVGSLISASSLSHCSIRDEKRRHRPDMHREGKVFFPLAFLDFERIERIMVKKKKKRKKERKKCNPFLEYKMES